MLLRRMVLAAGLLLAGPAMAERPLRIGTTAGPYATIMDYAASLAKAQGLDVKVVEFTDYTLPNEAMSHGDLDISNFQNLPYLENAVATRGYDIVAVERSIVTPLGVYSKKLKTLADLPDGAMFAIPNDPANGARSLLLLEHAGLIKVTPGAGTKATVLDIEGNPKRLRFRELDAAQVARSLGDVSAAAVNLNYAIPAGLDPNSALLKEDNETRYGLWFTTRAKDRADPRVAKLIGICRSPEVKQFILDRFGGTIIPTW